MLTKKELERAVAYVCENCKRSRAALPEDKEKKCYKCGGKLIEVGDEMPF